ncbi:MAG: hypothetical protein P8J37_00780 [Fuerstiella sp.]|nr:hypothetical protein [Fuerstiella sp.]
MFYPSEGKRAVRVDGSLVVYVWDESLQVQDRRPSRKYVFKANDLQNHHSKSKIGESYSFWIPWDDTGGAQKELTLVARFVGTNGAEITSAPSKVILAGAVPLPVRNTVGGDAESGPIADGVQQVSFELKSEQRQQRKPYPGLNTSEIHLTQGFTERNLSRQAQAFTSDELLGNTTTQEVRENPDAVTSADQEATLTPPGVPIEPPEDRSLRFQDRVRTSREAQRSVGRALTERYQSESRTAVWEKD